MFTPEKKEDPVQDSLSEVIRLTERAEKGDQYAMYTLGKLYLDTDDTAAALRWFRESAGLGNQYAQYVLGKLYLLGKDVPQDREAAVRCTVFMEKMLSSIVGVTGHYMLLVRFLF